MAEHLARVDEAAPFRADGSGVMFDAIAARYDRLNRLLSLGADRRWRRRAIAALQLGPRPRILDVASGTGDMVLEILRQRPEAQVVGVDPASRMLDVARSKLASQVADERVRLVVGDAQGLAFDDESFDAVCIAFGIRNVPDRERGLSEMARVLRPGGRLAVLELSTPRRGILGPLARLYIRGIVPWLGALLSRHAAYRYLERSIAAFPPPETFARMMTEAGLRDVRVTELTFGACHLFVGVRP